MPPTQYFKNYCLLNKFKGLGIFLYTLMMISCSNLVNQKVIYVFPDTYSELTQESENSIYWSDFKLLVSQGRLFGEVVFKPGLYELKEKVEIKGNRSLHLFAEKGARFIGDFDFSVADRYSSGFVLFRGNIEFVGFVFEKVGYCFYVDRKSNVSNVIIKSLTAKDVHSCIVIDRNIEGYVQKWEIVDVNIKGYYRVAIRLSGMNTSLIFINDVDINGRHGYVSNHCFKGGIQIYRGAHDIFVTNTHIENNIGNCGMSYQQGDGIEADNKGGSPYNLSFINITVENSRDANFDLKAKDVRLENIVSISGDLSRYGFKLWSYDSYNCIDCKIKGFFKYNLTLLSASAIFTNFDIKNKESELLKCEITIKGKSPVLKLTENKYVLLDSATQNKGCSEDSIFFE